MRNISPRPTNIPGAAKAPSPVILEGSYCRLEPLSVHHSTQLFAAISGEGEDQRHQYLFETPPATLMEMQDWIKNTGLNSDFLYFAVIDKKTGVCGGRQALMRIKPEHGVLEIGSILWGRGIVRTAIATEALFLIAQHIFEDLGYRRFEWKCDNNNLPSKRAAKRFGFDFESVFSQHMIIKGKNRDTAWFCMLDHQWPTLKKTYQNWLDPKNFDDDGIAKTSLATPR